MLVYHVGPPKTATSFLQHQIFRRAIPEAFYHWKLEPAVKNLVKICQDRLENHDVRSEQFVKWLRKKNKDRLTVLSSENISSKKEGFWVGTGPDPAEISQKLLALSKLADFDPKSVKVIFGARRQDQMLASRYSQIAVTDPTYTQTGFIEKIEAIIGDDKRLPAFEWLYFDRTLQALRDAFGAENVCVYSAGLLDKEPKITIKEIGDFCNVDLTPALHESIKNGKLRNKVNKKSTDVDTWQLYNDKYGLTLPTTLKDQIISHYAESNEVFYNISGKSL